MKKSVKKIVVRYLTKQFLKDIPNLLQILTFTSIVGAFFPEFPLISGLVTILIFTAYHSSGYNERLEELAMYAVDDVYGGKKGKKPKLKDVVLIIYDTYVLMARIVTIVFSILSVLISFRLSSIL